MSHLPCSHHTTHAHEHTPHTLIFHVRTTRTHHTHTPHTLHTHNTPRTHHTRHTPPYHTYIPHAYTRHTLHTHHMHTYHRRTTHSYDTHTTHYTHCTHTLHAHTHTPPTHGSGPGGLQGRLRPRVPAVKPQACGAARRWGAPEHERNTDANARARCTSVRRSPATRALARTSTRPVPRRRAADVPFKAVLTPDDGVRRAARRGRVQGARPPPGGASPGAPVAG